MEKVRQSSRLNFIMPYPAMIADELAIRIAHSWVRPGDLVLDPFVGTGRTLAAAALAGGTGCGLDVNPLAVIVTNSKAAGKGVAGLERFANKVESIEFPTKKKRAPKLEQRQVKWFSTKALTDLQFLVGLINSSRLYASSRLVATTVLFATIREASYCRKDQWKLHRLSSSKRRIFKADVKNIFLRRLRTAIRNLRENRIGENAFRAHCGDARTLVSRLKELTGGRLFDCVVTSPPYGDSKSTVQYGGMSSLCLEVAKDIRGLPPIPRGTSWIDNACVGGKISSAIGSLGIQKRFWSGEVKTLVGRKVSQFLMDMREVCEQIIRVLKLGGKLVLIVARRTVGGAVLYFDRWLRHVFSELGCQLLSCGTRSIKRKLTPYRVAPCARSTNSATKGSIVATMRREHILVFEKVLPS